MPQYCPSCGTEIDDAVNFCPDCGEQVGNKEDGPIVQNVIQQQQQQSDETSSASNKKPFRKRATTGEWIVFGLVLVFIAMIVIPLFYFIYSTLWVPLFGDFIGKFFSSIDWFTASVVVLFLIIAICAFIYEEYYN